MIYLLKRTIKSPTVVLKVKFNKYGAVSNDVICNLLYWLLRPSFVLNYMLFLG